MLLESLTIPLKSAFNLAIRTNSTQSWGAFENQILISIYNSVWKCIQMSTNKPSIGQMVSLKSLLEFEKKFVNSICVH